MAETLRKDIPGLRALLAKGTVPLLMTKTGHAYKTRIQVYDNLKRIVGQEEIMDLVDGKTREVVETLMHILKLTFGYDLLISDKEGQVHRILNYIKFTTTHLNEPQINE